MSADTPENQACIKTTTEDGVLRLRRDHRGRLHAHVTTFPLTGLRASNGSPIQVEGFFPATDLQLDVSSRVSLKGEFEATAIEARISSGGEAVVSGTTQQLDARTSSGASFTGKYLQATECQANASSGGSIAVAVQRRHRPKLAAEAV